jgi:hypothetical protein
MNGEAPLSWLMFFTLAAGIAVGAVAFLSFLRSRHNRDVAAYTLEGDGRGRGVAPSGALPELAGIFGVALLAMGLLTVGYNTRQGAATVGARAGAGTTTTATTGANNTLAPRLDPEAPKKYQPANPEPDTRGAPTSSSTGTGPDSGGHPEATTK